jgi:hypothetical protein
MRDEPWLGLGRVKGLLLLAETFDYLWSFVSLLLAGTPRAF